MMALVSPSCTFTKASSDIVDRAVIDIFEERIWKWRERCCSSERGNDQINHSRAIDT
jgi:hypothetical protein